MIFFGVCVASTEKFERIARPGIEACMRDGDVLRVFVGARQMAEAYNVMLDEACEHDDLEAVVLMHEDVELTDPADFRRAVVEAVDEHEDAVFGVMGAQGPVGIRWWCGELAGGVEELDRTISYPREKAVDAVDGLCLVITPGLARRQRFDEGYDHFHGYDVDYSLATKRAGGHVGLIDVAVRHHSRGGYGDKRAWHRANRRAHRKWRGVVGRRPLQMWLRDWIEVATGGGSGKR